MALAIGSSFFVNKVIQVFIIVFMFFIVAYLLLHASISSNRSIGTYDQWNTGYIGIALLYGLLLTSISFTVYLIYRSFKEMYGNSKNNGWWIDIDKINEVSTSNKEV